MEVSGPGDNARIIHNSHRVRKAGASASHHTHLSLWWKGITSRKQCHQYHQRWMCVATDKEKTVNYEITNSCLVVKFPNCLVSNHCHWETMKFPCWHLIGGDNGFDSINLRNSVKFWHNTIFAIIAKISLWFFPNPRDEYDRKKASIRIVYFYMGRVWGVFGSLVLKPAQPSPSN